LSWKSRFSQLDVCNSLAMTLIQAIIDWCEDAEDVAKCVERFSSVGLLYTAKRFAGTVNILRDSIRFLESLPKNIYDICEEGFRRELISISEELKSDEGG